MFSKTQIVAACAIAGIIAAPFIMVELGTAAAPLPRPGLAAPPTHGPTGTLQTYRARDGEQITVRRFDAQVRTNAADPVAILLHGPGTTSRFMSTLGHAFAAAGVTAYAPDWRDGDIRHVGQLEEDLDDLVRFIRHRRLEARFILVGFSAGGSFALRVVDEPSGERFARVVAIAPYLGVHDPATREGGGGSIHPHTARFLGLKVLNALGIHRFDDMPVVAFAPQDGSAVHGAHDLSYRMLENLNTSGGVALFEPRRTWRHDIRRAGGRLLVFFGAGDSGIDPAQAHAEFAAAAPAVPVKVIAGSDHFGLVQQPGAVREIVARALRGIEVATRAKTGGHLI